MLELKNICKIYATSELKVTALDNISLNFRKNEFVSILGVSGSGKTTLLNIIGGLDDYTDGDLIINNKSTKEYKDRDWDSYRNHRVGFVFQNYNLIPHQNALSNVELALTLSGVGKLEREKRAKEALKQVGLADQLYKKPNQMSGGQVQRIAIARALVNNPDILLADEPTGALDSETSIQIMDLLKKIANDRLVIMVTHNNDLANKYSTRIINLLDGKVINDSNPYEQKEFSKDKQKMKKTSMSFKTALGLSFNNLTTKKGRTILTSFAGAIGIIGIALIMSISNGVQNYINSVEEDTLSSYPITIEQTQIDASVLLKSFTQSNNTKPNTKKETIVTNNIMGDMISMMTQKIETNDLQKFKTYLETDCKNINDYVNDIKYSYNISLQIFKNSDEVIKLNPSNIYESFGYSISETYSSMSASVYTELSANEKINEEQYTLLKGKMPENYDEVLLIVDKNNMISDYTAYALGIKDITELQNVMKGIMSGKAVEFAKSEYTYDDLLNLSYKIVNNTDYYIKNDKNWVSMEYDHNYMKELLKKSLTIKVVGIAKASDTSVVNQVSSYGGIGYTTELTKYVVDNINKSAIAKEQVNNPETSVFDGEAFTNTNSSYQNNLLILGIVDLNNPSSISLFPKNFESKDEIKKIIDTYNENRSKDGKSKEVISYTDYVGLLMSRVTTIVDVISYVLIAFVSVSLIVSSIMIGIITYISVLERTKEIGILRSIGASKKDISRVFNAETIIIGAFSGIIGILVTVVLDIPINIIINNLAGINNIASLPLLGAIILIIISILLTIVAGLIPSKIACKKDPVEALRTE